MKLRSMALLALAVVMALSLWFVTAAILPGMLREAVIAPARQAALTSAVQAGFVFGALASAILGLSDRFDPRRVFAAASILAGCVNAMLVVLPAGSVTAIAARFITGALLAGVYPVAMKITVGWGLKDRGFLIGTIIGALTLGSASPHLLALLGGADWRLTVGATSLAAVVAGLLVLATGLGPHHRESGRFDPGVVLSAWTNRRVRLAYAGYLGHMWELYAMWAWIGVATAASYRMTMAATDAETLGTLTALFVIATGGITSIAAGLVADRIGKAQVAAWAMALSGSAALAAAASFGGPPWVTFTVCIIWGIGIVPDSAQFSGLVADAAPPEHAGSLMTFQTALGFALTILTVQSVPVLAEWIGWPAVLAAMAAGPLFGIAAMRRLIVMG